MKKETKVSWVDVTRLGKGWMDLNFLLSLLFLVFGPIVVPILINQIIITLSFGYAYRSVSPVFLTYPLLPEARLILAQVLAALSAGAMVFLWWRQMGRLSFLKNRSFQAWAFVFFLALVGMLLMAGQYETFLREFSDTFRSTSTDFETLIGELQPDKLEVVRSVHAAITSRLTLAMTYDYHGLGLYLLIISAFCVGAIRAVLLRAVDSSRMSLTELATDLPELHDEGARSSRLNLRAVLGLLAGLLLLSAMPFITFWELVGNISFKERWGPAPRLFQLMADNFVVSLMILAIPTNFILLWARVALIPETGDGQTGILYLRSFQVDSSVTLPIYPSFDVAMYLALEDRAVIRAVRNQRSYALLGEAQTALSDSEWQGFVSKEIERAPYIILSLDGTPGVSWELEEIFRQRAQHKTIFLGPNLHNTTNEELTEIWAMAGRSDARMIPLSFVAHTAALTCATLSPDGQLVGYSSMGTTGSHRAIGLIRALAQVSQRS